MRRERIEELRNWAQWDFYTDGQAPGEFPGSQDEFMELADLALRATDPEMVMVRKQSLADWCKFSVEISEQANEVAMEIDGKLSIYDPKDG